MFSEEGRSESISDTVMLAPSHLLAIFSCVPKADHSNIDCSTTLQRVHMPRHHVLPMVRPLLSVCYTADRPRRSFSVLGLVPGIIVTISVAASVQYTSLILWRFCLKHPEIRDVCDIGRMLFGGSELAYNVTSVFFILNNTFIQGAPRVSRYVAVLTNPDLQRCTVSSGQRS